jgi:HAD superfamily hydrolase (TIGR01484 family)
MQYRAVVFDIDGTAIPNKRDGVPSKRLIEAVAAAKHKVHLIAATGRPASLAMPIIRKLQLIDPCVISGGTVIVDPVTSKNLVEAYLSREQIKAIADIHKKHSLVMKPYDSNGDELMPDENIFNKHVTTIHTSNIEIEQLTSFIQELLAVPGVFATSTHSWAGKRVAHITTVDGSKEHGVKYVLDMLGVKRKEAIGVGDGDNDVHLFASVGHKVAMGNGSEELKVIADEVAAPESEDGLALVIERLLLG